MRYFAFDLRFVPFFRFSQCFTRLIYISLPLHAWFRQVWSMDLLQMREARCFLFSLRLLIYRWTQSRDLSLQMKELFFFFSRYSFLKHYKHILHVSRVYIIRFFFFFFFKRFFYRSGVLSTEDEVAVGMSIYIHERSINRTFSHL